VKVMGKPDAGNPHVRFDEGEGGGLRATPSLLYYSTERVLANDDQEFGDLRRRGEEDGVPAPRPGAVNMIQRFDSALRLNVHFHMLVLGGVYAGNEEGDGADAGEEARFHELPAPTPADLALILHRIGFRLTGWLTRKGWIDPDGQPAAVAAEPGAEASLTPEFVAAAVAGGSALGARAANRWVARLGRDPLAEVTFLPDKRSVQVSGFSLYVSPAIAPCARERLEQVCRYIARPPLATERLELTPQGKVLYRFRKPWKDGSHSVLLEPLAFLERLAALVPPPRRPLLTYHGVLAPAARNRERIVPAPREEPQRESVGACVVPPPNPHAPRPRSKRYYTWAELLRRVFATEVFRCPHCGGPRRLVAFITEPQVIDRILDHLGIEAWPQPPPLPGKAG